MVTLSDVEASGRDALDELPAELARLHGWIHDGGRAGGQPVPDIATEGCNAGSKARDEAFAFRLLRLRRLRIRC